MTRKTAKIQANDSNLDVAENRRTESKQLPYGLSSDYSYYDDETTQAPTDPGVPDWLRNVKEFSFGFGIPEGTTLFATKPERWYKAHQSVSLKTVNVTDILGRNKTNELTWLTFSLTQDSVSLKIRVESASQHHLFLDCFGIAVKDRKFKGMSYNLRTQETSVDFAWGGFGFVEPDAYVAQVIDEFFKTILAGTRAADSDYNPREDPDPYETLLEIIENAQQGFGEAPSDASETSSSQAQQSPSLGTSQGAQSGANTGHNHKPHPHPLGEHPVDHTSNGAIHDFLDSQAEPVELPFEIYSPYVTLKVEVPDDIDTFPDGGPSSGLKVKQGTTLELKLLSTGPMSRSLTATTNRERLAALLPQCSLSITDVSPRDDDQDLGIQVFHKGSHVANLANFQFNYGGHVEVSERAVEMVGMYDWGILKVLAGSQKKTHEGLQRGLSKAFRDIICDNQYIIPSVDLVDLLGL